MTRRASRLRFEALEDRTVPSYTVAPHFAVGGSGSVPVSVTAADFDGDGHLDAATANQDAQNRVSVLLGNGDGTFQPAATINIGVQPAFITAADLNADGNADLVTANKTDHSVTVLLGNGNGTFQAPARFTFASGTGPVAVAVGDLNGDDDLDLAVAGNGSNVVRVLTGDGSGQAFTEAPVVTVNTNPTSVALADFNGDSQLDIATVSGGFGHLNINLNTGGGTFGPTANFETGFCANAVTTGDFNHDGKADVAVACVFPSGDGVSVLIGTGDGTFVTRPNLPGAPVPYVNYNAGNQTPGYITTGDLDGDGNLDLVTANYASTGQFANNSISLLPGRPDGTFGKARVYYGGAAPKSVVVGDFDGDGNADVVSADSDQDDGTISMLRGRGDGTLRAAEGLPVSQPGPAVPADYNGDGRADLAVVTSEGLYKGLTVFPGLGDGLFGPGVQTPAVAMAGAATAADFNGDGNPDLAVTGSAGVSILLNDGTGTFAPPVAYAAGGINNWVSTGDFNGDGAVDLAVGYSNGMSVLLGNGNGTFAAATPVTAGGGVNYIAVDDLNGDTVPDLAVVNTSDVTVVFGNGNGTFGAPMTLAAGTPDSVSTGDFNGDGAPDLVATSFIPPGGGGSAILVWLNDGAGGFGTPTKYLTDGFGSNPIGSAVGDFDQDGHLDIVAANNFADTLSLFTGTGTGSFNSQVTMVVGDRPTWVAPADFTGDGRSDLVVVNSNSGTVTVLNTPKPGSTFRFDVAPAATAGNAFQVTVTALDEEGNRVTDYTGTVTFTSTDPQAVLPGAYTFEPADGGTHTFDVTLKTAGPRDLTVTGGLGSVTGTVQVSAAAADHFELATASATTAGDAFDVTVRALDPFGNLDTAFLGTVQFGSDDPNPAAVRPDDYAFTTADNGTHTFAAGFKLVTAGPRTVTVTAAGFPVNSVTVTTAPAAASGLTVDAPADAQAGSSIDVTVTVADPYGNRATGFTGTVQFTSTDPIAGLPTDYTFTAADQGRHTFPVTLKRAGTQTVSAAAAGLTAGQSPPIVVAAGVATEVVFVGRPADTFPKLAIPGAVTVQFQDQFDNPVPVADQATLSLASGPPKAKLKGALSGFPDGNGTVAFSNVVLTKPGEYTLTATGPGGMSAVSDTFTVYKATKLKVKMTSVVAQPTAGDTVTVTVTARDARGKPDPTYRGTVHFTSKDLQAVLPADYTFTAADNGTHSFDVTLRTAGAQRIAVNDMTKVKVKGRTTVKVLAGAATRFAVSAFPLSAQVNKAYAFTVTALDQFGNRARGYAGTVTIGSNGSATIAGAGPATPAPAAYTFTAADQGRHVFRATFTAPGTGLSLTVTDQADPTIVGSVTDITVV
ncbi:MAG TPA: VCBS repeat-containing protein [Gemmataceae bacterium]|nr:VCBS repeat-containing protein [Gemmataceae bacterium]